MTLADVETKIELSYGTGLQQVQKAGYTPDTCMFFKTFCNIPLRVTSEEYRKVPWSNSMCYIN